LKNKRALTILFIANGISGFAQGITMLAIPWYFKNTLNQPSVFILAYAVITLLTLFWGLYAGDIVDGFNRKDVFLGTNFIEGLIILSVASLGFKEGSLPIILILLVFTTTFFGYFIHYPNLYAFAQEITDPKDYTKVTSYIEIVGQTTTMASAMLGGFLINGVDIIEPIVVPLTDISFNIPIYIKKWELYEIILLNGITYLIAFIIIIFIKTTPVKPMVQEDEGDLVSRMKVGYQYLKEHPLVTVFGLCSYSIFIITLVEMFALRPLYVQNHLQENAIIYSLSELLFALGSLFSGIIIRQLFIKMPIPKSIIILTLLTALMFVWAFLSHEVYIFYAFSFVVGFTNAGSRIFRVSYLFNLIPNEITGRVNGIFNVVNILIRILFIVIFIFPFFSIGSNVTYAYLILGLFTLIAAIVLIFLYKPLLRLTERAEVKEDAHH
jgi:DHA3 family macrolide efflux protein-like MFS transporter